MGDHYSRYDSYILLKLDRGTRIASMEEKMLLPQATKLNETRQLLAKQTHVAHVQQPLATTNTNHDNLNDNTQQIQFVKEINLLKYRYSSLDRQGDYPDLASSRMLHDLFSERVHSYLGYLNRSEAFEAS